MNPVLVRTIGTDERFQQLVTQLDAFTAKIDGEEFSFFAQFNKSLGLKHVILYIENGEVLGCGAFKMLDESTAEIKRMFVKEEARGKRIAENILIELEKWAKELNATEAILETGVKFESAIQLYKRLGYSPIENYGQYINVNTSRCFAKQL